MGRIYTQAYQTLAFIGDDSEEVVLRALDFIVRLNEYLSSRVEDYQ